MRMLPWRSRPPRLLSLPNSTRWKRLNFEADPGFYRLEVKKTEPGTLSFTQPFGDTRWSRLTPRLLRMGTGLQWVGSSVLGLIFVFSFFLPDALRPEAKEPQITV